MLSNLLFWQLVPWGEAELSSDMGMLLLKPAVHHFQVLLATIRVYTFRMVHLPKLS